VLVTRWFRLAGFRSRQYSLGVDALLEVAARVGRILSDPGHLYNTGRTVSEVLKIPILGLGILLVLAWRFLPKKTANTALLLLALTATLNYSRWGPKVWVEKIDAYDLVHYYVNAKYFDEIGYYDLYPAAILVDHSNGGPHFKEGTRYLAQDEDGHGFRSIAHALRQGRKAKERFTPERWEEFETDILWLQRESNAFTDKLWRQMLQDHGFNGTPAWTVVARPLANMVPVQSIKILCFIDVFLLIGATLLIGWAYGRSTAMWLWLFFVVSYSTRWPTFSWSYLRYDYIAALVAGMAMLKKKRHFAAGLLTGWAAAMRLFPLMWLYGPGMKGIFGLLKKQVDRRLVALALGTVVGVVALEGVAMVSMGPEQVKVHFENMLDHNSAEQLSSRRIGMAMALPFEGPFGPQYVPSTTKRSKRRTERVLGPRFIEPERKKLVGEQKTLRYAIAGMVMLLLGWGLRKSEDDEAYAFGFIPLFLLTTASYYYYVARATLIVLHAADLKKTRNQVGLVMLLLIEMFSNYAATVHAEYRVYLIGNMAWGLCLYTAVMALWFIVQSHLSGRSGGQEQAAK
jgi:hypothetical protein